MASSQSSKSGPMGIIREALGKDNPVLVQVLGICSALAVTSLVSTTLVMGLALMIVTSLSCLLVSLLRDTIPYRVRLMVQMMLISVLVILIHLYLRAYHLEMSKSLGPYVGLIITNCIVLGRCEAFALRSKPLPAFLDGLANGAGYALVLLAIAIIREPLGGGTLLGYNVVPTGFQPAMFFKTAPGAFLTLGVVVWVVKSIWPQRGDAPDHEG
ncbi:MAG: Rnf-Nqr domain containing protein [Lentisphaeria bacterium]|jgi:Na+-transporting NADH:ubiquinone oxidoreductase subunit D